LNPLRTLEAENLELARGGRLLQSDLNFHAVAGEILAIGGRNGIGKTSLLRAIAGLLEPRSGTIRLDVDGQSITSAEERGQFVGWIGQQDGLKSRLTPFQQLKFHLAFNRCVGNVEDALARSGLGLARDLSAQYLSQGQRRRLAFARLILTARPLWLLDEPMSALDGEGRSFVRASIEGHCAAGGIVVAATHEPLGLSSLALELC
jgi:heme exporter protein A